MYGYTGKVALAQKFVEFVRSESALDKDDDLVKLQVVQKFVQLAILLRFAKFDIVLLETVQGELGIIIDVYLERVSHELFADGSNVLRKCGAKHHDLLIRRSGTENLLNIASHICKEKASQSFAQGSRGLRYVF